MANGTLSPNRVMRSPEEIERDMLTWVHENPEAAASALADLRRIVNEAPIHAALLGELAARYKIPRPVSAFVRLHKDEFRFLSPVVSRTGSPAICLVGKEQDDAYWAKFRRKGLEAAAEQVVFSPWTVLGIKNATAPFGETRLRIFEAFMWAHYGTSTLKDMAAVCADFKRESGVSFASFFNGLRPAEVQETPLASARFTWSWSTDTPPCLSCAIKSRYVSDDKASGTPNALLVAALTKEAAKKLPEDIDFSRIATEFGVSETVALSAYIPALRTAVRFALLNNSANNISEQLTSTPKTKGGESLAQLYRLAQTVASAAEAMLAEIKRIDPSIA